MSQVVTREFTGVLVLNGDVGNTQFHVRQEDGKLTLLLVDKDEPFMDGKPVFFHNAKVTVTVEYQDDRKINVDKHL